MNSYAPISKAPEEGRALPSKSVEVTLLASVPALIAGEPTAKDVVAQKGSASHPFAAHD